MTRKLKQYESETVQYLTSKLKIKRRASDTEAYFRRRLVYGAANLSQEEWDKIPTQIRAWVQKSIDALNHNKALPPLPDEDNIAKRRAEAAHKGTEHRLINRNKKVNASWRIMELLLTKGIDKQPAEIIAIMGREGYRVSTSTVRMVATEFRRSLRVLESKGLLAQPIPGVTPKPLSSARHQ